MWERVGAIGDPGVPFADLVSRYAEPWRVYHTLGHIDAMIADFDELGRAPKQPEPVRLDNIEMAIWYHDIVYDTHTKDNEERSAEVFRSVAEACGLADGFVGCVVRLILGTKHVAASTDPESAALCDIDLGILGQPESVFDEYERGIRKEYDWVSDQQFRAGRAAILLSFIQRPAIYSTDYFRDKYEEKARRNLGRSIDILSGRG